MAKKEALIIFVKAPELGKVKTRLAKTIGNENALKVYNFLVQHTYNIVKELPVDIYVFYDGKVVDEDIWIGKNWLKLRQEGKDLGEKMEHAFKTVMQLAYKKVVIIGSDCFELTTTIIEDAFQSLKHSDTVIGPAKDGGYYLLGMKTPFKDLFKDISWSTYTVAPETLKIITGNKWTVSILPQLSDVDKEEDITFSYL